MGLIIKKSIQKLMPGFPTVSDKYNVQGGVLGFDNDGDVPAYFGCPLFEVAGTPGTYETVPTDLIPQDKFVGIALGTNVKLATTYPADADFIASYKVGEAVNCMIEGFVAVPVAAAGEDLQHIIDNGIPAGAQVYLNTDPLLGGVGFTPFDGSGNNNPVNGMYFTGIWEVKSGDPIKTGRKTQYVVAEVYLPMTKIMGK